MERTTAASGPDGQDLGTNIAVCVRVRPMNRRETKAGQHVCWLWDGRSVVFDEACLPATKKQTGPKATPYMFDHVFAPDHRSSELYDNAVRGVVGASVEGYHASVFAYGQTSTGKTFTMQGTETEPGIIPLSVADVFQLIRSTPDREFLLRMSYMEIYNETLNDLLAPSATNLRILEDPKQGCVVRGLRQELVVSEEQIYSLISVGEAQRHVGSTNYNEKSSRSHTIFQMVIESKPCGPDLDRAPVRVSSLSLTDLAGSESLRLSGATGQRRQEGAYINKSLLTLGHVIKKLSDQQRGHAAVHIPYRDSKLTRILQPSLSGHAQVAVVCTVSPASGCVEETTNTLKFADRAKQIKHRAIVNEGVDETALIQQYEREIVELRKQLEEYRRREAHGVPRAPSASGSAGMEVAAAAAGAAGAAGAAAPAVDPDEKMEMELMVQSLERLILNYEKPATGKTPATTRKRRARRQESGLGMANHSELEPAGQAGAEAPNFFRRRSSADVVLSASPTRLHPTRPLPHASPSGATAPAAVAVATPTSARRPTSLRLSRAPGAVIARTPRAIGAARATPEAPARVPPTGEPTASGSVAEETEAVLVDGTVSTDSEGSCTPMEVTRGRGGSGGSGGVGGVGGVGGLAPVRADAMAGSETTATCVAAHVSAPCLLQAANVPRAPEPTIATPSVGLPDVDAVGCAPLVTPQQLTPVADGAATGRDDAVRGATVPEGFGGRSRKRSLTFPHMERLLQLIPMSNDSEQHAQAVGLGVHAEHEPEVEDEAEDVDGEAAAVDVDELERIKQRLKSMLERRKRVPFASPAASQAVGTPVALGQVEAQVEALRVELQCRAVDKNVQLADSMFLRHMLEERELELAQCMEFIDSVEERLAGMAQEMAKVQQDNERLQAELAARDCEIERLKQAHASTVADTT